MILAAIESGFFAIYINIQENIQSFIFIPENDTFMLNYRFLFLGLLLKIWLKSTITDCYRFKLPIKKIELGLDY